MLLVRVAISKVGRETEAAKASPTSSALHGQGCRSWKELGLGYGDGTIRRLDSGKDALDIRGEMR